MIKFSYEEGFIKSRGIRDINGIHDSKLKLPHIAVGVFSVKLFEDILEKFECNKVGEFGGASYHRPVYELKYKDIEITLFIAGISGPWIASDIEDLNYNGVDTFIIFGNCGVLDKNIEDCSIIIPNKAFRDEGTSYHYIEDSESIEVNNEYTNLFIKVLENYNFSYTIGATWTTDAFYRETRDKINYFKNKGAVCVEMEASAIAAVCKYKNIHYFTFYYAGDNLDSVEWEERSVSQLVNFDKKKEVPKLALELALLIEKNK